MEYSKPSHDQGKDFPTKQKIKHKRFDSLVLSSNGAKTLPDKQNYRKNVIDYYMANNVKQEINETIQSFRIERNKQHGTLNAMRNELKQQRIKSVLDESKSQSSMELEMSLKLKKYKQEAKQLELELIQERAESNGLRKLLSNYESENANLRESNEELKKLLADFEELKADFISAKDLIEKKEEVLHENKGTLNEAVDNIKDSIKKILREGTFEYDYRESNKDVVQELKKYITFLINSKKNSEAKYAKLLELHNKLIEINSKGTRKYTEAALIEENNRLKFELEKNRVFKL